ncbi:MAG TPA: phosphatidylinositol-specific phospholipase C/glycerophosphodiester phosphodiesterase family protein [Planctomicrobium sp.]|nr:phosphatidylinositol-specific phospholipase C/glycerophosphodiester phosphodiesterase family protein [Planctomicrobium sp.]
MTITRKGRRPVHQCLLVLTLFCNSVVASENAARPEQESTTVHRDNRRPLLHSHNDYLRPHPLVDALEQGFQSVEADVFLLDGKLLVGHFLADALWRRKTLQELYLQPLRERIQNKNGFVHDQQKPFFLLIEIKSDATTTYEVIHSRLEEYADILSCRNGETWTPGAVTVVITGRVPRSRILQQTICYAGIDGSPSDRYSKFPPHVMPWISERWGFLFQWNGEGEMPESEKSKLADYLSEIHSHGRSARFWGTPEKEKVWQELVNQGVDLLGTDRLSKLKVFDDSQIR